MNEFRMLNQQTDAQLVAHKSLIFNLISELSIEFHGGSRLTCKSNPNMNSESDLITYLEVKLHLFRQISANTPLSSYWKPLILEALTEARRVRLVEVIKAVSFIKEDEALLEKLIQAITGNNNPVDVAVFKHFIWQVKRKLLGKDVTWHMMPVIWGKTGSGKSELLRKLFVPLTGYVLTGMSLDKFGDDRYYRMFNDHFICFLDEMPKIEKASIEAIKQVITADELTGRILNTHGYKAYKQNATFISTSNEAPSQLIKDTTSMRRFHYIKTVDRMDYAVINSIDMLKVWQSVDENRNNAYILDVFDKLQEVQEDLRTKDSVEMFIVESNVKKSKTYITKAQDIYDLYIKYCEDSGYKLPLAKQSFYRQLIERLEFTKVEGLSGRNSRYPHFYVEIEGNNLSKILEEKRLK